MTSLQRASLALRVLGNALVSAPNCGSILSLSKKPSGAFTFIRPFMHREGLMLAARAGHLPQHISLPAVAGALPVELAGLLFGQVDGLPRVHQVRVPVLVAPAGDRQARQGHVRLADPGGRGAFLPRQQVSEGCPLSVGERAMFGSSCGRRHRLHSAKKRYAKWLI